MCVCVCVCEIVDVVLVAGGGGGVVITVVTESTKRELISARKMSHKHNSKGLLVAYGNSHLACE